MKFIKGINRGQENLFPVSLEQSVGPDNEVRLIYLFADTLPVKEYGFGMEFIESRRLSGGHQANHPGNLLKLFMYEYLNKVRSCKSLTDG